MVHLRMGGLKVKHSVICHQCRIILHVIKLWDICREREPIRALCTMLVIFQQLSGSGTADVGTAGFIAEKEKLLCLL